MLRRCSAHAPLIAAAIIRSSERIAQLIALEDVDLNVRTCDPSGLTALHYLALREPGTHLPEGTLREETAKCADLLLCDPRIDVNTKDRTKHQRTPLMVAVANGREFMVQKLLQHKDINLGPYINQGYLAVYELRDSHVACLRLLLKDGRVSLNDLNPIGMTALISVVRSGNIACVHALLECAKVDVNVRSSLGYTALHFAAHYGACLHSRPVY